MSKKRQASSTQQQRRAARGRPLEELEDVRSSHGKPASKSYIVLRSTLPPDSFIPAVCIQVLAVVYCLLLLHGRPNSLFHISALLRPLIYDTKTAMLKSSAGLLLVQLYLAIQLKLWSDRSEKPRPPKSTEVQGDSVVNAEEVIETSTVSSDDLTSLHKILLKIDLSRLDLPSVPETILGVALSALIIFLLTILMGAPLSRLVLETVLFSLYLSILAFTAPLHVLRSPFSASTAKAGVRAKWSRLFAAFQPRSDIEIALLLPAYGAIIGSMVGVIPEGLDWEVPWQKWPVPCLLGSLIGWILGQLATLGMCSVLWLARAGSRKKIARELRRSEQVVKSK